MRDAAQQSEPRRRAVHDEYGDHEHGAEEHGGAGREPGDRGSADPGVTREGGRGDGERHQADEQEPVEHALHADRRECRAEPHRQLLLRHVGAGELAGAHGQQIVRHEADRRRMPQREQRERRASSADIPEDQPPAQRAEWERERRQHDRAGQEQRIGAPQVPDELARVDAVQRPGEERERDHEPHDPCPARAGSWARARGWTRRRGQRGRRLRPRGPGANRSTRAAPPPAAPAPA